LSAPTKSILVFASIIPSHPASSGFDNSTYYGLNAFWFVDNSGISTFVRWSMVLEQPFAAAETATAQGDKH
jgi:catalase